MPKISDATLKYTMSDKASTIVVIKGLAITAGSKPNFWLKVVTLSLLFWQR